MILAIALKSAQVLTLWVNSYEATNCLIVFFPRTQVELKWKTLQSIVKGNYYCIIKSKSESCARMQTKGYTTDADQEKNVVMCIYRTCFVIQCG